MPFTPGRMDTTQEHTDVEQFNWLQPVSDGFRNYHRTDIGYNVPGRAYLPGPRGAIVVVGAGVDRADRRPARARHINWDGTKHGVFTDRPGVLSNDFFKTLTTMDLEWQKTDDLRDRRSR